VTLTTVVRGHGTATGSTGGASTALDYDEFIAGSWPARLALAVLRWFCSRPLRQR